MALLSAGAGMVDPRGTWGSFGASANRGVQQGLNTYVPLAQWQQRQEAMQAEKEQERIRQAALVQFMNNQQGQPQGGQIPPSQFAPVIAAGGTLSDAAALQKLYGGGTDPNSGYYGNVIYTQGPDGTVNAYQPGKAGNANKMQFGPNEQIVRPLSFGDIGGGRVGQNVYSGAVESYIPKSLSPSETPQTKAAQAMATKQGAAQAEASTQLADMEAQMPRLETVVNELDALGQKATYTEAGQALDWARRQAGMDPRESAIARKEYISKVDNEILPLLRQTFGAQFTEKEGQALKATLGDPDASPQEKSAVLRSFIATKQEQVKTLQRRTGQINRNPQGNEVDFNSLTPEQQQNILKAIGR